MVRPLFDAVRKPGGGIAVLLHAPVSVALHAVPWVRHWLSRAGHGHAIPGARRLMSGRTRAAPLVLFSHHFMSRYQIRTALGLNALHTVCLRCR